MRREVGGFVLGGRTGLKCGVGVPSEPLPSPSPCVEGGMLTARGSLKLAVFFRPARRARLASKELRRRLPASESASPPPRPSPVALFSDDERASSLQRCKGVGLGHGLSPKRLAACLDAPAWRAPEDRSGPGRQPLPALRHSCRSATIGGRAEQGRGAFKQLLNLARQL